jgi:hypothetical protein
MLALPAYAHAEPGIAMLPEAYPVMLLLFVPAVLLQVAYLWKRIHPQFRVVLRRLLSANALALLIGFPLAWLVVLILQVTAELFVTGTGASSYPPFPIDSAPIAATAMTAAWLFPGARAYGWMLPLAFIILLLVAWPIAWYAEWFWLRGRSWPIERADLLRLLRRSNWMCFALLLVAGPVLIYLLA